MSFLLPANICLKPLLHVYFSVDGGESRIYNIVSPKDRHCRTGIDNYIMTALGKAHGFGFKLKFVCFISNTIPMMVHDNSIRLNYKAFMKMIINRIFQLQPSAHQCPDNTFWNPALWK